MKLTDKRKEIIDLIYKGEIEDLQSFIEYYYKSNKIKIDKKEIKQKKKKDYENIKDDIEEYANSFLGKTYKQTSSSIKLDGFKPIMDNESITNKEVEELKRVLRNYLPRHDDFEIRINNDSSYNILDKEIYLIDDFDQFEDFYFVWTYLLKEEYIVLDEVENKVNYAKFFFTILEEMENNIAGQTEIHGQKALLSNLDLKGLRLFNPINYRHGYKSNDMEYMDFKVSFSSEEYRRYNALFNKKIITLPSLKWFIERKFVDVQQYTLKKTLKTTYLALIIPILFSSMSLYFSVVSSKSNTEFWKQTEQNEAISQEYVNTLLEKIVENSEEQAVLIKNLNELINKSNGEKISSFEKTLSKYIKENEVVNSDIYWLMW